MISMDNSTATSYINLTYDEEVDVYFAFVAPFTLELTLKGQEVE